MDKNNKLLKKLSPKTVKALKITLYTMVAILIAHVIYFCIVNFTDVNPTFYSSVFILPVILFCTGVSAIIMPYINQNTSYQANTRNDKIMVYIGICLIIASILTLVLAIVQYNTN